MLTLRDRPPAPRPGWQVRPPAQHRPLASAPSSGDNVATLALTALTIVSAIGFVRVFEGQSWVGPVMLTALVVHGVCWATRRWRIPQVLAIALAAGAVWLIAVWTILGFTTHYGIPGAATWHAFRASLTEARQDFTGALAPVTPTEGFRMLAALGTGVVALLSDWIALRWRSLFVGAAPAFALFVVCSAIGAGPGRLFTVTLEVIALISYLLVHRLWSGAANRVWFAGDRSGLGTWALTSGAIIGGCALLVALTAIPMLAPGDGVGFFGWRGGPGPGNSGPRIVANPIVDLQTRLLTLSGVPVFIVDSNVPSYWRLTSLDTFTGDTWISTGSYRGFGARLPTEAQVPPGTRTVEQHFQIQQLESVWLPDAFTPVSVRGVRQVTFDSASGSLITSRKTSDDLQYDVTSYQYLSTLSPSQLQAAPALRDLSSLKRYLALPDSVSPEVKALASKLTAGFTGEYDKAIAIERYLLSPTFSYNLAPVSDGSGNAALDNFLFTTHTGYCQQFAGAYAVLARAAGLPTRLAVGFATGQQVEPNVFQVTDSDAHTWPEIYFGPQYGWLPFEPTPSFSNPSAKGYAGSGIGAGGQGSAGNLEAPARQGSGAGGTAKPKTAPTTPTTVSGNTLGPGTHKSGLGLSPVLLVFPAIVLWAGANAGLRRLRWSLRRRSAGKQGPAEEVLSHWSDVSEMLAWWGVSRGSSETDNEFAARAARRIGKQLGEPSPWLAGGVSRLAGMAYEAAFASATPAERPAEASLVATEIHHRLFRAANARQILAWALLPAPGMRRRV